MIRLVDIYRGGKIDQADVDFLYVLLAERPPEANISHREMPTPEQHRQFVHRKPYACWYIIGLQDGDGRQGPGAGAIYLTQHREIGIFVLKAHQRRGIASAALEQLRKMHPGPILANVAPLNDTSHQFFRTHGGRVIQTTYEL